MAADGESTGKSKGRAGRRDGADIGEFVEKDRRLGINELETIPTMVPLLSDRHRGY
jgi:predicted transport protein